MAIITEIHISKVSDPKFSAFISNKAADAINPITTGRNPMNIPRIATLSLWRAIKWLVYATRRNDGRTTTSVQTTDPSTPHNGFVNPACKGAAYPI